MHKPDQPKLRPPMRFLVGLAGLALSLAGPQSVVLAGNHDSRAAAERQPAAKPLAGQPGSSQNRGDAMLDEALLAPLEWRHIGPAISSGRIVDFAVVESNPKIVYAASASGGIWKTVNNGSTWEPIFEQYGSMSMGAIAISPTNPNIVWAGTGESNNQRSSSWGDGVYKSEDGGKSFSHVGLRESQHVGSILIHPEDPDIVYVAALGALWGPNRQRGLFKTIDGGRTWRNVLSISNDTGVVDVQMDPRDPDVLYAGAYQRRRRNWSFVGGGPESGLYRSTDAGDTWQELANGLPEGDIGKIGISICRSQPDTLYAIVEASGGGVFRSDDRGASWEHRNNINPIPWYYSQIRCDPNDAEKVYVLGTRLSVSEDGGRSFRGDGAPRIHVDHHAMWIDPADSDHLIIGNDGGVSFSWDGGQNWDFMSHIPVVQFYTVAVDMQEPFYYVYGGTQDNNTWGGPNGTRYAEGITNEEWYVTVGGDGFYAQIDPEDNTVVYSESQYGGLVRFDTRTGERRRLKPADPEDETYRWNWSAPLLISPHDNNTLYFAANVVFRSRNRGDLWEVISADLTRQLDRDEMEIMGRNWPRDAISRHSGTSPYGNITTMDESTLAAGLLAVGTDDGLIHVTRDGGQSWRRIEDSPRVPELTRVSRVAFSRHDEGTIFAAFDGHKDNNFLPYVYRSGDYGESWTSITGDLPDFGSTRVVREHPRNPNLLFVGTEFGVFVSITGGDQWVQLKNNLPTIAVHDMVIHPRENDLVIGTHGRGFWVLDDITPLEELTPRILESDSALFSVRPAMQFNTFNRGRGFMGSRYFRAPNPPRGAIVTYYVNPRLVMDEDGGSNDGTGGAGAGAQRSQGASSRSSSPRITLEILDAQGGLVRRLDVPQGKSGAGLQRTVWDMRHAPPYVADQDQQGGGFFGGGPRGPWVLPGEFQVRLRVGDAEQIQSVTINGDPLIEISAADRRLWHDTLLALSRMQRTARAVITTAEQAQEALDAALETLESYPAETLAADAKRIRGSVSAILRQTRGGGGFFGGGGGGDGPPPIATRVRQLYNAIEASTATPTEEQSRLTRRSYERLIEQVEALNRLVQEGLPAFNDELDAAGIPWTPGRLIVVPPGARPPQR